jgi:hypothetical protein
MKNRNLYLENAPDAIILEHANGNITLDLSSETLYEVLQSLTDLKTDLQKLDASVEILATDEHGDSDRGIGMEWSFVPGQIFAPDFGYCNTVGEAISEIEKFFSALDLIEDDEDQDFAVVKFD